MAERFMQMALEQAQMAFDAGEVPVGAVLVDPTTGEVLAATHNHVERDNDPTAHAEMVAIRSACARQGSTRLPNSVLYVTLEPCAMCATAIAHARISKLVFAAYDVKGGGVEHGARIFHQPTCHHHIETIGGVMQAPAATLLQNFFSAKR